jgi:hypothetical protein
VPASRDQQTPDVLCSCFATAVGAGGQSTGLSKIALLAMLWVALLFALLYKTASDRQSAACMATSQVRRVDHFSVALQLTPDAIPAPLRLLQVASVLHYAPYKLRAVELSALLEVRRPASVLVFSAPAVDIATLLTWRRVRGAAADDQDTAKRGTGGL